MKEKLITRTIYQTKAEVIGLEISSQKVVTNTYNLAGQYDTASSILPVVKKFYETEDFKPVSVLSFTTEEHLYGVTEQEFLKIAKELPPRKVYEKED